MNKYPEAVIESAIETIPENFINFTADDIDWSSVDQSSNGTVAYAEFNDTVEAVIARGGQDVKHIFAIVPGTDEKKARAGLAEIFHKKIGKFLQTGLGAAGTPALPIVVGDNGAAVVKTHRRFGLTDSSKRVASVDVEPIGVSGGYGLADMSKAKTKITNEGISKTAAKLAVKACLK